MSTDPNSTTTGSLPDCQGPVLHETPPDPHVGPANPNQGPNPLKGLPTSVTAYAPDLPTANAPGARVGTYRKANGVWQFVPDPTAADDPLYAMDVEALNAALRTQHAAPGSGGTGGAGITVDPESLVTFANNVQTVWDATLGPQGTSHPPAVARATNQYQAPTSLGVFGSLGHDTGLVAMHDQFRSAAIELLNEIQLVMGAIPTKVVDSKHIYLAADQRNADNLN